MTTQALGLIGSGNIGSALARLAVTAGLDVVLSNSRGPQTLSDLVAELGGHARAATPAEAAQAGDLVVATVPMNAYDQLPAAALAGKTVIDTMNYYPDRDGHIAELDAGELTSSALVQRHLAGSQVVKAFNSIDFRRPFTLARPAGVLDLSAFGHPRGHGRLGAGLAAAEAARVSWLSGHDPHRRPRRLRQADGQLRQARHRHHHHLRPGSRGRPVDRRPHHASRAHAGRTRLTEFH